MATAYKRLRVTWGGIDYEEVQVTSPGYALTDWASGGTSAAAGSGVGVRRASVVIDRATMNALMDPALMHFDFLNMTSGNPDDTWITSDYGVLETAIQTWWTGVKVYIPTTWKLSAILWHRVGTGVTKPNPAERIFTLGAPVAGTGGTYNQAPQAALSITFRTGVRKSWGRTYLPFGGAVGSDGMVGASTVDAVATATGTLVSTAATNDMHLVVVSAPLASSLNVENIQVDNVIDVIRRRRVKRKTYAKVLP